MTVALFNVCNNGVWPTIVVKLQLYLQWRNYVRRGEATASGRQAAEGRLEPTDNNCCSITVLNFEIWERTTEFKRMTEKCNL